MAQMGNVKVGRSANSGGRGVIVGRVHAHGRHHDAILERHIANLQRSEQRGRLGVVGVHGGADVVGGREEGRRRRLHDGGCLESSRAHDEDVLGEIEWIESPVMVVTLLFMWMERRSPVGVGEEVGGIRSQFLADKCVRLSRLRL